MGWLQVFRLIVLAFAAIISLPALVMSAVLMSSTSPPTSAYLNLVASIFTLGTLPTIMFLDVFRKAQFALLIIMELSWLSLLGSLWIVVAGIALALTSRHRSFCDAQTLRCSEEGVILGLAATSGVLLLGYTVTLLARCVVISSTGSLDHRPARIWMTRVSDDFSRPRCASQAVMRRFSYASGTLELFTVKHDYDPFRRVSTGTSILSSGGPEGSLQILSAHAFTVPCTPLSSIASPTPLIRSVAPMDSIKE